MRRHAAAAAAGQARKHRVVPGIEQELTHQGMGEIAVRLLDEQDVSILRHVSEIGEIVGAAAGAVNESEPLNANAKLLLALRHAMFEVVPSNPGADVHRQGNTLGKAHRHWRRIKIGQRFRLFFRYDARARIIVYAWVNDEKTLRTRGARNDAYTVFQKMLDRGNPPDSWDALVQQAHKEPERGHG